ncbi:hypothetical protein I204_01967 [Kwoniella mangroviensis CBS 8886]|uniref:uncharacterized protein n=1 Tax=Kwoniella mangroviensis CBS 8507 TaxID=1296122 RepID=UPI00080D4B8D|nr:uncharacterized protein I203_03727 [Kwoniella mangroviensis CBS 8507]OCF67044.1 hypothetical protein I203_03727 [Kwoniella mangroviensis CBS 8507]OCF77962.1 hypothetical protein I204_01967 [Kwoniella mangroviensis CBS 8886]
MPHSTTRWHTTTLSTTQENNLVTSSRRPNGYEGILNGDSSSRLEPTRITHTLTTQCTTKTTHRRKSHSHRDRNRDRDRIHSHHHHHRENTPRPYHPSSENEGNIPNRGGRIITPVPRGQGRSVEETDQQLAQDSLMLESANWSLEEIQAYIDRMAIDETETITRACPSPIPDQALLLSPSSNSSSSSTLVPQPAVEEADGNDRRVRFNLPESINPMRLLQPHFKDHLIDNKVTIFGHVAIHPGPDELFQRPQESGAITPAPFASKEAEIKVKNRDRGKTYFPKLNGLRPLTKIINNQIINNHDSSKRRMDRVTHPEDLTNSEERLRTEIKRLNDHSTQEEGRKFILDIIENRLSEIDYRIEHELNQDKKRRYRELKWDLTKLFMEVRDAQQS